MARLCKINSKTKTSFVRKRIINSNGSRFRLKNETEDVILERNDRPSTSAYTGKPVAPCNSSIHHEHFGKTQIVFNSSNPDYHIATDSQSEVSKSRVRDLDAVELDQPFYGCSL